VQSTAGNNARPPNGLIGIVIPAHNRSSDGTAAHIHHFSGVPESDPYQIPGAGSLVDSGYAARMRETSTS
jgi:hypothetical protein